MAASDDDVGKKRPNRLEKEFKKFEVAEKNAARAKQYASLINELKATESSFLTPLANYNSDYQGFLTFLSASNPTMSSQLKALSDAASVLHKDYPARFFDAVGNLSVEGYKEYLAKLSDIATQSASFNSIYVSDLEFHAKAYNRTLDDKGKLSVATVTSVVSTPFQRGPRHQLLMKDIVRYSDPNSQLSDHAKTILVLVEKSNTVFNDDVLAKLPQRKNADVIQFIMDARANLMKMSNDPQAMKIIAKIEERVMNDVDHKLSFADLKSVFSKRSSIIFVKTPVDTLVEKILNSPEMKQNRQSVTRGSGTPSVEAPKVEAAPIVETPKVETPKVETPKVETPKVETPKAETPKAETPKAEAKSSVWVKGVTPNASKPTTTERSSSNLSHEKLKAMIVSLHSTGWMPNALPDKSNATMPIEIKKEGDSFIITPDKLTTSSSSVETYKAMLQAFSAVNPNKEPKITTNNPEAVKAWQQAYKETFPGKPVPTNLVEVKIAKAPVVPAPAAPEERRAPSPK